MKRNYDNITDDEIRVIGTGGGQKRRPLKGIAWAAFGILLAGAAVMWLTSRKATAPGEETEPSFFEPDGGRNDFPGKASDTRTIPLSLVADSLLDYGCCEVRDTVINDVGLKLFIPHKSSAMLHVGPLNPSDKSIIYATQAADIRADNGKILGAFVLEGKPLAWGLSKKGYCAIISDSVSVGVSENSPLFEEATEKSGYFFRQYPLVDRGRLVESELKNKSERRAICQRGCETLMVHSMGKESMHDFAQALVDLGADNAVYLVGSSAYGWAVDEKGRLIEWGEPIKHRIPENTSYLVWKKKTL